jgi:hypothetical protein
MAAQAAPAPENGASQTESPEPLFRDQQFHRKLSGLQGGNMRTSLLVLHFIGLAAFLGGVFVQILLSVLFPPETPLSYYVPVLQAQRSITLVPILGGLALLVVSGAGLTAKGRFDPVGKPWLLWKILLSTVIVLIAIAVLAPAGAQLAELAAAAAGKGGSLGADFVAIRQKETLFGEANLALSVLVIIFGIRKKIW